MIIVTGAIWYSSPSTCQHLLITGGPIAGNLTDHKMKGSTFYLHSAAPIGALCRKLHLSPI